MANEMQLNSHTDLVNFTSDYEYVLGATQGRLLQISGMFHSMSFCEDQLQQIRLDLETTAKNFAEQQGLAPGAIGWGYYGKNLDGTPILRENTGTLYNGIKAVKSGQTIHLRSEARDKYGHYYGGHVEFGHRNVPARPHLRPALYMVSQASQGLLRSAMYNLLTGAFNGNMTMAFGTGGGRSASYYRKGAGEIEKAMFRGSSGRQAKYHFGSIRNYRNFASGGKGASRKAQMFRSSFANTAKKSMGWGKQKSLNAAQRSLYNRAHSSSGRRSINQKTRQTRQILSRSRGSKMTSRAVNRNIVQRHSMGKNKGTAPRGSRNRGSKLWNQHWRNQAAAKEAAKQRMENGRNYFAQNTRSVLDKIYGSVPGQSFISNSMSKGSGKTDGHLQRMQQRMSGKKYRK